jgi:shikimate dehydrogenase
MKNITTVKAGLIGQGILRSLTPAMQEAEGKAHGINLVYDLFDTNKEPFNNMSLLGIVESAQQNGYVGLNITHPYKIEILEHLDGLSDSAEMLGAVNTVIFQNDKRIGHNTDFSGFLSSFRKELKGADTDCILLLGSGGAASAVAFALVECGVRDLLVYDVNHEQALNLVTRMQQSMPNVMIRTIKHIDEILSDELNGVVNATPMGMEKYPGSAFPMELLKPELWIADIVYFPLETELLASARITGCRTMSGACMAVFQAAHAFELFTGLSADTNRFIEIFKGLTRS